MRNSKQLAVSLTRRHGTCNPFTICQDLGYIILFKPLGTVRGLYRFVHRCHIIYINDELDEQSAKFVCAHELGHSLLHKGFNRVFMDVHTHMITSRFETEADRFAVDLLFDDCTLQSYLEYPIAKAAEHMGISHELARYRMSTVQPVLFSDY